MEENFKIMDFKNFNPNYITDKMEDINKFGIWSVLISKNNRFNEKITSEQTDRYFAEEMKSLNKPTFHDYYLLYHTLSHDYHTGKIDQIELENISFISDNIAQIKSIIERDSLGKEKFIINYSERNTVRNYLMTYAQVERETFLVFFREFFNDFEYCRDYFKCFQIFQSQFSPILNYLKFDLIAVNSGI
jgi:hypothetical protein